MYVGVCMWMQVSKEDREGIRIWSLELTGGCEQPYTSADDWLSLQFPALSVCLSVYRLSRVLQYSSAWSWTYRDLIAKVSLILVLGLKACATICGYIEIEVLVGIFFILKSVDKYSCTCVHVYMCGCQRTALVLVIFSRSIHLFFLVFYFLEVVCLICLKLIK